MQLDVECKTTPMADAMLLQLLKGQQMKLDATFTKALVKREYHPKFVLVF